MPYKEELSKYRDIIDEVDAALVPLFARRMEATRGISRIKHKNNLPLLDSSREAQVVERALTITGEDLKSETALLMRTIIGLSREYQRRLLFSEATPLLHAPVVPTTKNIICAYQGVPGSWSNKAAASLYPKAELINTAYFDDVFATVKSGAAHYGVVPIENSKTGAIGETYDLLRRYGCYIVGRTWIPIRQCLVGLPSANITDIRKVFSHPEGLKQCAGYLSGKPWEQIPCSNTAVAAKQVAELGDKSKAAIASAYAAELYGLKVLAPDIMDAADNRTSFVVIAAEPQYDEKSDLISVTFSTLHRSGALCEVLMPFMAAKLDLLRIESRPVSAENYRFFCEIQGNILSEDVLSALRGAAAASEYFEVLGCYSMLRSD